MSSILYLYLYKSCSFSQILFFKTLGSSQAWGVKNISLADNGHVSFSNPVRQSLFLHEDAVKGKEKSKTAAERLQQIYPGLVS